MPSRFPRDPSAPPQRPLTRAQERALVALVGLCAELGSEADPHAIGRASGMHPGGVTLALRGLERRGLAIAHGADRPVWAPTLTGRALARAVRAARDADTADEERRVDRPDDPPDR